MNLFSGKNGENGAAVIAAEVSYRPDIVFVVLGTNDMGLNAQADAAAFTRIRDAFTAGGAKVYAIGPPAFARGDHARESVVVYDTLGRVFGAGNVIDWRALSGDQVSPPARSADLVHFTSAGAQVAGQRLAGAVLAHRVPLWGGAASTRLRAWWPVPVTAAVAAAAIIGTAVIVRRRRRLAGALASSDARYATVAPVWRSGGCLTFAKALRRAFGGGRLVDIVEPETGAFYVRSGRPHHVMVERDGLLWDAAGAHDPAAVQRFWSAKIGAAVTTEPHDARRAREQGLKERPALAHAARIEAEHVARNRRAGDLRGATKALPDRERENIPKVIAPEIDGAVERALAAGATAPLEYIGAGAEGIVFCDPTQTAYKVGRAGRGTLVDEADFFRKANQVASIKQHVAKFKRYDASHDVLVRECVRQSGERHGRPRRVQDSEAWDIADRIAKVMAPYGFTAPERKGDSYVFVRGRGPVLVDGGFVLRRGHELVKHVLDVLNKRKFPAYENAEMLAAAVRDERGVTIPPAVANKLLRRLYVTPENARKWVGSAEAAQVFGE